MKTIIIVLPILLCGGVLMADTVYYCPKCGSTAIEIKAPVEPEKRVSMDDWPGINRMVDLVVRYSTYTLACRNCGYEVKKTVPFGP